MEQVSDTADEDNNDSDNNNQLSQFLETWQEEIKRRTQDASKNGSYQTLEAIMPASDTEDTKQAKAKELFMNGVWCEQNGLIYEAMEYYRKATKIIPDIDIQMETQYRQSLIAQNKNEKQHEKLYGEAGSECEDISDLCSHFSSMCYSDDEKKVTYCSMERQQRAAHISTLPSELLTYILRWIISSDLDVRSLENFSMVCRGFYVLARDIHLWRNVCASTWGLSCQSFLPYKSWREMFIERPHLYFHGVYMNKVQLYRQGDATLERFYPPWMKVTYYRYLRFFSDGAMLMHTSAADPITVIPQLNNPKAHMEGMCKGMYRVKDNKIACILKRVKRRDGSGQHRRKGRRGDNPVESETTFYIDLSLHGYKSQPNVLLKWEKYTMNIYYSADNETNNEFKLTEKDFPACKFARVKSYVTKSQAPLENQPII